MLPLYVLLLQIVNRLRVDFSEVTGLAQPQRLPSYDVFHHIVTQGLFVFSRPRRLRPNKLNAAKAQFKQWEESSVSSFFLNDVPPQYIWYLRVMVGEYVGNIVD